MSMNLRMVHTNRIQAASHAALVHFLGSVIVAAIAAFVVFFIWFPFPYGDLSGGRKLFFLVVGVDVVCGPLLTLVLFSPKKSRRELVLDLSLVVIIQLAALAYGVFTTYQARPLFLVHEVDRFRVINLQEFQGVEVSKQLDQLPSSIKPEVLRGPIVVGTREPLDRSERTEVLLDAVSGGRDYSQRPEFYIPFDNEYRLRALKRAKPLRSFLDRFPEALPAARGFLGSSNREIDSAFIVPVLHKQEWVAILNPTGEIVGFLPGDGFAVP
jgi:hypothetical protein